MGVGVGQFSGVLSGRPQRQLRACVREIGGGWGVELHLNQETTPRPRSMRTECHFQALNPASRQQVCCKYAASIESEVGLKIVLEQKHSAAA